jgi:type 1 glutamine amidotransferase
MWSTRVAARQPARWTARWAVRGVTLVAALVAGAAAEVQSAHGQEAARVLVFSRTDGFRHSSIPAGVAAVRGLGTAHGFAVEATEDASVFTPEGLSSYDVVLFLSTTENVLDEPQQAAMEQFIRGGGGFVGVHAAADTEYDWAWYGRLVGGYFMSHPRVQEATLDVVQPDDPAVAHLPERWTRTDEWYDFKELNPDVTVLMTIDADSYEGSRMGAYHPMAWKHEYDGGRAFYTGLGHTEATYADPQFLRHLLGGIEYAAGRPLSAAPGQDDDPERTEVWEPEPAAVAPGAAGAPPSDAIVLFDGSDLGAWTSRDGSPAGWSVGDGAMTVVAGTGDIVTRQGFGDVQLHVEWRTPRDVVGDGQGRGNSGVFLMQRYEVQVLDSYDNRTYSNGQAASLYKQHIPMVNASRGPGEWQAYDIVFRAPRFAADGTVTHPAVVTVFHNGVLVQDHVVLRGPTVFIGEPAYEPHGEREPIQLQDHGNPVSYRNIWVRELPSR